MTSEHLSVSDFTSSPLYKLDKVLFANRIGLCTPRGNLMNFNDSNAAHSTLKPKLINSCTFPGVECKATILLIKTIKNGRKLKEISQKISV